MEQKPEQQEQATFEHDAFECRGCAYDKGTKCILKPSARNAKQYPERKARCRTVAKDTDLTSGRPFFYKVYTIGTEPRHEKPKAE